MAGSYCRFCDHRCFVERRMPADATWRPGETVHLATCTVGKRNDRVKTGYDADTAINPSGALLRKLQQRRLRSAYEEAHEARQALTACLSQLDVGTEAHQQIQAAQLIVWPAEDMIRRELAALTKETP